MFDVTQLGKVAFTAGHFAWCLALTKTPDSVYIVYTNVNYFLKFGPLRMIGKSRSSCTALCIYWQQWDTKKNALKKIQSEAEHSGFAVVHVM